MRATASMAYPSPWSVSRQETRQDPCCFLLQCNIQGALIEPASATRPGSYEHSGRGVMPVSQRL